MCPLVLLASSVTSTKSSLPIFSMTFTILYIVIRLAVLFPSAFLHMLGSLVPAPSLAISWIRSILLISL
ncbi:hypothetical protein E2C01_096301 [Portunus trituberculatus]|uniref:Uncharacterized protein n=1 Tax=Portunus trituberculatus TaxID=210409 RepID=A0A5B7JV93_PORTR|nr:hypothetical protein [Portunus trituberculatus]